MTTQPSLLRIGTRGSRLALTQAEWVAARLAQRHPGVKFPLVIIQTTGDKLATAALARISGKGAFTKEVEEALLDGRIDVAVHSLKDLPTQMAAGLRLGAIPAREHPGDALVGRAPVDWRNDAIVIATSSPRRRAQLMRINPVLTIVDIRGNVPTRIEKTLDGAADAAALAEAGLNRLELRPPWREALDFADMLPAPGQGALGLQIRAEDAAAAELLSGIHDPVAAACCAAERAFLEALGGGCRAPIAALGRVEDGRLTLDGVVASVDGAPFFRDYESGDWSKPEEIGRRLAANLRQQGAGELIDAILEADRGAGAGSPSASRGATAGFSSAPASSVWRVVVTRDEDADGPLSSALRATGAEPLVCPFVAEAPPEDPAPLRRAIAAIEQYDWIVFSSVRGVRVFIDALREAGKDARAVWGKIACVGPKTAAAAAEAGLTVDVAAEQGGAEGLLNRLKARTDVRESRALHPRGDRARPDLRQGLIAQGATVDDPIAYRTVAPNPRGAVFDLLRRGEISAVAFASPSAVEAFVESLGANVARALSEKVCFAAIGPTTADALRAADLWVGMETPDRTFAGLATALAERFAPQS